MATIGLVERDCQIVDAYERGMTLEKIAREFKVSNRTARKVLTEQGIAVRQPGRREVEMVPAKPFVSWLRRREEEVGTAALSAETGFSSRWVYRYKNSLDSNGRPTNRFERHLVEDALIGSVKAFWELYPDLEDDEEIREGFCSRCDDRVLIDENDRCLGCETPTTLPMSRAERRLRQSRRCKMCGGKKSRHAVNCWSCYQKLKVGSKRSKDRTPYTCPHCGGPKSPSAMRCNECKHSLGLDRGWKRRSSGPVNVSNRDLERIKTLYESGMTMTAAVREVGNTYKTDAVAAQCVRKLFKVREWRRKSISEGSLKYLSEDQLQEIHNLYESGKSMGEAIKVIGGIEVTGYSNMKSAKGSLYGIFKTRGWKLRPRKGGNVPRLTNGNGASTLAVSR